MTILHQLVVAKKPTEVAVRHASCEVPFAVVHHVVVWLLVQLAVGQVVLSQLAVDLAVLCEEVQRPVACSLLVAEEEVPFLVLEEALVAALLEALVLQQNQQQQQQQQRNRRCHQARPGLLWVISTRPRFRSRLSLPSLSM